MNLLIFILCLTFTCLSNAQTLIDKTDEHQKSGGLLEQPSKFDQEISHQTNNELVKSLPTNVQIPSVATIEIKISDQRENTKSEIIPISNQEDIGWKEFIASLMASIAWPSVLIIIFILLKSQIIYLFNKVAHFKYKDMEVDFERVKSQAEAIQANEDKKPEMIEIPISEYNSNVFDSLEEQILETAEASPSAAILLAWSSLEAALSAAVNRSQLSDDPRSYRPVSQNIETLERSGVLSKSHVKLINEMRHLRNRVSHESETLMSINQNQAFDYSKTAIELISTLNSLFADKKIFNLPKGNWIYKPENFLELKNKNANFWNYSNIKIPDTNLTAGVGPWSNSKGNYECFSIDIEMELKSGSRPITELVFDLSYVSKELIDEQAKNLVTYDQKNKIITFDLGNSTFRYQLN